LFRDFPGADVVFPAELSLYGTFWEVPEVLFYRRFHPGAPSSMDRIQLHAFWDPNGQHRIYLREWRHFVELARAVARAPLVAIEKMRASRFLALRAAWNRDKLGGELLAAVREVAAGTLQRSPGRSESGSSGTSPPA
jgi:hypothetical protein